MTVESPEIYFHVGLGKVASTYLQKEVFPKLEDIYYLPTGKYRRSKTLIPHVNAEKILVSREFDRQFEEQVRWFTSTYPTSRIIIIFRRHDSWIASQYRRHVKNGYQGSFGDFFDLKNDEGYWRHHDLLFHPKLKIIEECCEHKPLVLFHNQLKKDPWGFIDQISTYTGSSYQKNNISLDAVHKSFSEKQLKVLRAYCRRFMDAPPRSYGNKIKHWLLYRPWWAFFHLIMYMAAYFPDSWVPKEELINPEDLRVIRNHFQEDWDLIQSYANTYNPDFMSA